MEVKNMKGKTAVNWWKWALLVGGGLGAAVFLWGCFNPILAQGPDGKPAGGGQGAPESFTVTVLVEGGPGASASREVTGPDAGTIQSSSLRNIVQLIVADGAGNITSFSEARRKAGESSAALNVKVRAGDTYHFLVLQGHWPYTGGGPFNYDNTKYPTLLAAGFASLPIQSGSNTVSITMRPLAADTAFVFVPAAGNSGYKPVEARKEAKTSHLVTGGWKLNWTMIETATAAGGIKATGFDPLLASRKAADPLSTGWWYAAKKQVLNGTASESGDLSVTGNLVSLSMDFPDGEAMNPLDAPKYANFNLEYVPFGLTGNPAWSGYDAESAFNLSEGDPVWIIRNGTNDLAQDINTDYTSVGKGGKNGNGAVNYRVLAPAGDADGDGITNEQEIRWGLDPAGKNAGDSDGDYFSDKMETDNGFDPLDKEDNPGKASPGSLEVTDGAGTRTSGSTTAAITFKTGGYTGEANVYYKVKLKDEGAPAYHEYDFLAALGPGLQKQTVSLAGTGGAGDAAYYVYVVIMKDRNVSISERILPEGTPLVEIPTS
jgi:hypothetical protein